MLEDGINSLAYGHHDIPVQVVDVVDERHDEVFSAAQARERGIRVWRRPPADDPTLTVPNRPRCIWQERQQRRVTDGREYLREQLGFAEDNDDDEESAALEDDDDDDDDRPARTSAHYNPFILDSCAVSRSRRRDSDSE